MPEHSLFLIGSFALILGGSEIFTNGIEWAGERLNVAEAAVGSLLAAVGTALPETFIPAVALLMGGAKKHSAHSAVGLGAIIGAPLMLSTVALFVMGVAGLVFRHRRRRVALHVPPADARRDLAFFIPAFMLLVAIGTSHPGLLVRRGLAVALLALYVIYALTMLRIARSEETAVERGLYFARILHCDPLHPGAASIGLQVLAGVLAILFGARVFVEQIVLFAHHAGLNPGVLSLILSPLATELPEKYNSVVWIRQRKDHLAMANITGAMVFQSCIPVAIGVAFTPWHLSHAELIAGAIALVSSLVLYFNLRDGELDTAPLMLGGVAYATFIALLIVIGLF